MQVSGTATASLDCGIEHAWEVLADHAAMSSWGPGIKVIRTEDGSPHVNGVGAVRRISTPLPAPAIVEEVTAFEPQRFLGYRAISGVPLRDYRGEVELSSQGDKTWVSYTVHANARIPLVDRVAVKAIATALLTAYARAANR